MVISMTLILYLSSQKSSCLVYPNPKTHFKYFLFCSMCFISAGFKTKVEIFAEFLSGFATKLYCLDSLFRFLFAGLVIWKSLFFQQSFGTGFAVLYACATFRNRRLFGTLKRKLAEYISRTVFGPLENLENFLSVLISTWRSRCGLLD